MGRHCDGLLPRVLFASIIVVRCAHGSPSMTINGTGVVQGDMSSGSLVANDDCVTDGPGNYGNGEAATMTVVKAGKLLMKGTFVTEAGCDYLTLPGDSTEYGGSTPPANGLGLNAGETISWRTDDSATRSGFTLCVTPCAAGKFYLASSKSCTDCSQGKFGTAPSLSECTECGEGKFGTAPGLTSAVLACTGLCSQGKFGTSPGFSSDAECTECSKGKWAGSTGLSADAQCSKCSSGRYSAATGLTADEVCAGTCPVGRHGAGTTGLTAAVECATCPAAKTTVAPGAADANACAKVSAALGSVTPTCNATCPTSGGVETLQLAGLGLTTKDVIRVGGAECTNLVVRSCPQGCGGASAPCAP